MLRSARLIRRRYAHAEAAREVTRKIALAATRAARWMRIDENFSEI